MQKTPGIFEAFNYEHFTRIRQSAGKEKADEYRLSFKNKWSAIVSNQEGSNQRKQLIDELKELGVKPQWLHLLSEEKLQKKLEEIKLQPASIS